MIHVHIESPSVDALQAELTALLGGINKGTILDVVQAVPHAEVACVPAEKTSGEIVKQEPAAEPEAVEPVEEESAVVEKYPSMTDTRAVLNKLRAAKGPKAVKEILTAHGVNSFVDLDSADYAAVMAEAEEALNG